MAIPIEFDPRWTGQHNVDPATPPRRFCFTDYQTVGGTWDIVGWEGTANRKRYVVGSLVSVGTGRGRRDVLDHGHGKLVDLPQRHLDRIADVVPGDFDVVILGVAP